MAIFCTVSNEKLISHFSLCDSTLVENWKRLILRWTVYTKPRVDFLELA